MINRDLPHINHSKIILLFDEGYVESLRTATLKEEGTHLFVGKVRPAMKDTTDDGKNCTMSGLCQKEKQQSRSVLMARRTCKGGQDGGCKHIAACLYSLEDVLHNRESVTSGPCQVISRKANILIIKYNLLYSHQL
jgi:hypothetical protein